MTIKIVTDSTITIEPALLKTLDITVVPLSFSIDGVIYTDGDLTLSEYMDKTEAAENLPKTSQPPVGVFTDVYDELSADGSEILSIHISESLSGTVEAARQGAALTNAKVTVIDSGYTDQGLAFQVLEAAKMAKEGKTMPEIVAKMVAMQAKTELFCGVSNLENLVKGGRIGRVSGIIGNLLDVKLVLHMKEGALSQFIKGRGNKTFVKWLDEVIDSISSSEYKVKEIAISHVGAMEFAQTMRDSLQSFIEKPITILETTPIIATHTGRGAWALMFMYE